MVHRGHLGQLIVDLQILHDGEVEVLRIADGAGNDPPVLDLEAGILVRGGVPAEDRGVIVAVAAAVEVDAQGVWADKLAAGELRGQILVGIGVVELVVIRGLAGGFVPVFHEIPQKRVDTVAHPLDGIAALEAGNQTAVVVDGVEFVFLGGVVPGAGVDDQAAAVRDARVGDAHLAGRVGHEVILGQLGEGDQLQPLGPGAAVDGKAGVHAAGIGQRGAAVLEADVARVVTAAGNDLDRAGLVRLGHQAQPVGAQTQVTGAAVHRGGQPVQIVLQPVETPEGDIAAVGDEERVGAIVQTGQHSQRQGIERPGRGRLGHQRLAGHAAGIAHQSVGLAVQAVGLIGDGLLVPEGDLAVRIAAVVICREAVAVYSALHVPIEAAVGKRKLASACGTDGEGGALALRLGQHQAFACMSDVLLDAAVAVAPGVVLVGGALHLFKIVKRSFG